MEHEKINIKTELENEPDNLENFMAFYTPEIEKKPSLDQQETRNQTVINLEKKICELKNQVLEKDRAIEEYCEKMKGLEKEISGSKLDRWMDAQNIKYLKDKLSESALNNELLRQKKAEAKRTAEELSRKISAYEEEKKMADWRESENVRHMEDLRRQNMEDSRSLEEFRLRILASEEELKRRESEYIRRVEDLSRQNLEANQKVNELKDRVLACEEEMEVRESDLRRQLSRAEEMGVKACKAAEVNMKRFGNVVPIAEQLCLLLKMRVDDLVLDFAEFGKGATTTHEEEGGVHASKALELTLSDQSTKAKKRYSQETQTTPSSAEKITGIIDCDGVEDSVKRSKHIVEENKFPIKRKRIFGADMARAFMEDDELCVLAVCALYRHHCSSPESAECPNRRFYHFEASRGCALGDYLIHGDPELSQTRSVDEVKQKDPNIVNQCRSLAIFYSSYFTAMPGTHKPFSRSLSLELVYDV